MEFNKSSRHSKITGDFGESLVLYWLSKYGFECAIVDHTGIDIIANNPNNNEVMGISVKTRSRSAGTERTSISIPNKHFKKVEAACEAFNCTPYFAIVADTKDKLYAYVISMQYLTELFKKGKQTLEWKMGPKHIEQYKNDPKIVSIVFNTEINSWWEQPRSDEREGFEECPLPSKRSIEKMIEIGIRFRTERNITEEFIVDSGAPIPSNKQTYSIHPASKDFFQAFNNDEWIIYRWDYGPWHKKHERVFRSPDWIANLSLREIQKWLTYYSRELRWTSLCIEHSITKDIESGILPALIDRLESLNI